MTSFLRPDEKAAETAIAKSKKVQGLLNTGLKGTTALAGAALGTKILPLLNEFVPAGLAMKGMSKMFPKAAEFLRNGEKMGLDVRDGMNFLKSNIEKEESSQRSKQGQNEKNIIQQYSPELFQEISDIVKQGGLPIQAASKVYNKYKDIIGKIQKDNKVDWLELVESIFGQPQQNQNQEQQQAQSQPQQPQTQAQIGSGNALLLQALQSINQRLGG